MTGHFIFIGLILLMLLLVTHLFRKLRKTSAERIKGINQANNVWLKYYNELAILKKEINSRILKLHGPLVLKRVGDKTIYSGMPSYLLLYMNNEPKDKMESYYKGTKTEKWFYGDYYTRLGTIKYKFQVTIENGVVVGWKDLV